jgi:hypothetical protein
MSSYASAQGSALSAHNSFLQGRQQAINTRDEACTPVQRGHSGPACRIARRNFRATMAGLRATYGVAVVQFHAAVESARLTFWGTIRTLRRG